MHKVVAAINKAKKPLICAGGGVILGNGEECVRQFCEKNNIPLVTTMMGIGVMPKNHPLYFGMLGNNGKPYANRAVANSDLLIIAGARIADRAVPKPENLEQQVNIIHIDIDTAEIAKTSDRRSRLSVISRVSSTVCCRRIFPSILQTGLRHFRISKKYGRPPCLQRQARKSDAFSPASLREDGR